MSRTYTGKPSTTGANKPPSTAARLQGARASGTGAAVSGGRVAPRRNPNQMNDTDHPGPGQQGPGQNEQHEIPPAQRAERRGAYTVISPNEKKRNQIKKVAEKEMEDYDKFKESQKLRHVSYVGTAGGGTSNVKTTREQTNARVSRFPQTSTSAKYQRIQKSQQYRDDKKRREEDAYSQKKTQARKQTEQNKANEAERQARLKEDHRRKNAEFLKRFEKMGNSKQTTGSVACSSACEDAVDEAAQPHTASAEQYDSLHESAEPFDENLQQLLTYFPHLDPECLGEILTQANGSVEDAIRLLS